jgi:catechol 2,3-dioxygenase-like lactoylglutathione lyase family enzyme
MGQISNSAGSWAKSIFAVTLLVENLQVAKQFYIRVFDLPVDYEDENSAVFKFGSTLINLLTVSAGIDLVAPLQIASHETGSRIVFTIHVDDVDALCDELMKHGVNLLNGPIDRPWGVRTASFVDADGYIWEIAK